MAKTLVKTLPFCPLPLKDAKNMSKPFLGMGALLSNLFPNLSVELKQADIELNKEEYSGIAVMLFVVYFLLFSLLSYAIATRLNPEKALPIGTSIGFIFATMVLLQLIVYPKIIVKRKVREIERHLVFAIRAILIQLKSGVTLFDALKVIATGNFGVLSSEFEKAVNEMSTGRDEKEALDSVAANNPSLFLRRTLWQIVNGMRAGADTATVLKETISTLTMEQSLGVRKYGEQLRLLSLIYMMLGVIIPALGITFLIILTSFPQMKITELIFWGLLGMVLVSEFMFLGIVKSKRPNLLGEN